MSAQETIRGYETDEVEAFAQAHRGRDSGRWETWPTWQATRVCNVRLSYTYNRKKPICQGAQENVMESMELFTAFMRHSRTDRGQTRQARPTKILPQAKEKI